MKKTLIIVGVLLVLGGIFAFFKWNPAGTETLWNISQGGAWLLPLIAVSALLDSVNPCAFSILFLTIGFLVSIDRLRKNILRLGGAYIAGLFAAYLAIGLGLLSALHLFNTPNFMGKLGAGLMIALGAINLINQFFPAFPIKPRLPHVAHKRLAGLIERASIPAALLLGFLVGLCEFPCTGGPYLTAVGLLHDRATYLAGFGYLLLYNVIFVLPLALIVFLAGRPAVVERVERWQKENKKGMRFWIGLAMIVLGVLILAL